MSSTDHLLTKTRFKIGLECPTKLYYLSEGYPSSKDKNEFLQVHADGGHQVGEYAKFVIQAKYPTHQFELLANEFIDRDVDLGDHLDGCFVSVQKLLGHVNGNSIYTYIDLRLGHVKKKCFNLIVFM